MFVGWFLTGPARILSEGKCLELMGGVSNLA